MLPRFQGVTVNGRGWALVLPAQERRRRGAVMGANDRPVATQDGAFDCSIGRCVCPTAGARGLGASVSAGPGVG
eukprot:708115-Alexandrium_andersonii.AAC.1